MKLWEVEEAIEDYQLESDPEVMHALAKIHMRIHRAYSDRKDRASLVEACRDPERLAGRITELEARIAKLEAK